jgi:hypothetical protein
MTGLLVVALGCGGDERRSEPKAPSSPQAPAATRPANTGRPVEPVPPEARAEAELEPLPPEPAPLDAEALPLSTEERRALGFPGELDLPEDARPSELPGDVPLPAGASAISEPMRTPEGFTHGTYAFEGSASSVQTEFSTALLSRGWSIQPASGNATDKALITATKGNRQVLAAIETIDGKTQLVVVEMEVPAP